MEIKITTGTYNTSDYRVVKSYKSLKSAQKFVSSLGYKSEIESGLKFSSAGIKYKVDIL
jgi:hypothetical protein